MLDIKIAAVCVAIAIALLMKYWRLEKSGETLIYDALTLIASLLGLIAVLLYYIYIGLGSINSQL